LEDADGLAAVGGRMVDDRGDAVVRRDREERRLELLALADVHRMDLVLEPGLLEEERDLVAVGRGPVMKVDHRAPLAALRRTTCISRDGARAWRARRGGTGRPAPS